MEPRNKKGENLRVVSVMWGSYLPAFIQAAEELANLDLAIFSNKAIEENSDELERFFKAGETADVVLFYWTHDAFYEEIRARLSEIHPDAAIVTISYDPSNWGICSTVSHSDAAMAYSYMAEGGRENYKRLLSFCAHFKDETFKVAEPVPMPWQGIFRPPDARVYDTLDAYGATHPFTKGATVGILFARHSFTNGDACLEQAIIEALEKRSLNVLPIFCHGNADPNTGSLGPVKTAETFFLNENRVPRIQALINLHYFFLGREKGSDISETAVAAQSIALFKKLNVPVFKPVVSYSKSVSEWKNDPQGLTAEVCFGIAMPEFEGNIDPLIVAASKKETDEKTGTSFEIREVIPERIDYLADRVAKFVRLGQTPVKDRRVVFVFHKNECAGLEANVGGAAGLDSGESVVRIMKVMAGQGYQVEGIPDSGEDLMQLILERKAIAEFRWTTVDEIISKKGHLALLDNETYSLWFDALPQKAKEEMIEGWGPPPGREMNGVPPSMVHDGKLVITGLNFGNVNIMMQPKRGCAGARCDGQVCKILHDPDIPPPPSVHRHLHVHGKDLQGRRHHPCGHPRQPGVDAGQGGRSVVCLLARDRHRNPSPSVYLQLGQSGRRRGGQTAQLCGHRQPPPGPDDRVRHL